MDVLWVIRTAVLARAYVRHLSEGRLGDVRVCSLGALADERTADVAVLTGMAPTWARWVYRSGIAPTLRVLAYSGGRNEPGGFDETSVVRRAVADQNEAALTLSSPERRAWSWATLSGAAPGPPPTAAVSKQEGPRVVELPPPAEVPPGLWETEGWFADLEPGLRPAAAGGSDRVDRLVDGLQRRYADIPEATLRRKLAGTGVAIQTVRGVGYRLEGAPAP